MGRRRTLFDPDVLAWVAAITAAGSEINANNKLAANSMVKGLKSDGVWPLITEFYIYAGPASLPGALVKAKGTGTRVASNFVSADFSRTTGLLGNGTSKYVSNGFLSSALSSASHGLFVYGSNFPTTGSPERCAIGAYNGSGNNLVALDLILGGLRVFRSASVGTTGFGTSIPTFGSMFGCRTALNLSKTYQDGVNRATHSTAVTPSFAAIPLFSFAINDNGNPNSYSPSRHAVEAITAGMTDDQALMLHNRVAAYVSTLTDAPAADYFYRRPDGTSRYLRPDGVYTFKRP